MTPSRLGIDPRTIIEASRDMAKRSRDAYAPQLLKALRDNGTPENVVWQMFEHDITHRMNLVMDCFNTGAAMMLKILHGDLSPEPWTEDYDHETRLRELLKEYGLLAAPAAHPEVANQSSQDQPTTKEHTS